MVIEYTYIKGKSKGVYKNAKTATTSVEPNETPTNNPTPVVYPEIDNPDFDGYPQEVDYPDYDTDYGFMGVDSEIDRVNFHLLRNNLFEHDNKDCTILESTYYQDLDTLIVFGVPPFGDLDSYCIWQYKDYCTDLKFVGKKEVLYQRYKTYCLEVRTGDIYTDTGFVVLSTNPIKEYLDRLEPDGRYFPKKQLNFFG